MPNATTADARVGYEIYLQLGPAASLGEVNDRLTEAGLNPVSERMGRHYRRLAISGSERYISINRFDIASAARPYESLSANTRYQYLGTAIPVRVTFPRGRHLVSAFGQADRLGEAGVLVSFEDQSVVDSMSVGNKPTIGEDVRVDFFDPPRFTEGRVVEVDVLSSSAHVEIEFGRLESISDFVPTDVLATGRYGLTIRPIEGESVTSLDSVGRQVFLLFELIEAARVFVNRAGQASGSDTYADVPEIESLEMRSPLLAIVALPEVVTLVLHIATGIAASAYGFERWRKMRLQNAGLAIDNQSKQAKANVDTAMSEAQVRAIGLLQEQYGLTEEAAKPLSQVFERQVLRAVRELAEMGTEVDVQNLDSDPDDETGTTGATG